MKKTSVTGKDLRGWVGGGVGGGGVQTQDDRWWKLYEGGRQLGRVTWQGEGTGKKKKSSKQ